MARSGFARRDRELRRRPGDLLHHKIAIHMHACAVDPASGTGQDPHRLFVEEMDADFLQDAHRAIVDAKDGVVVDRFDRPVAVDRRLPGELRHVLAGAWSGIARTPAAPGNAPPALQRARQGLVRTAIGAASGSPGFARCVRHRDTSWLRHRWSAAGRPTCQFRHPTDDDHFRELRPPVATSACLVATSGAGSRAATIRRGCRKHPRPC